MPELVVIDEMLETGGTYSRLEPLGLKRVLRPFRDECRRRHLPRLPAKCVLWSQRYTPGLAYAFVTSGGTDAFGRDVPSTKLLDHLWAIHDNDEVTWRHDQWRAPKLQLNEDQLAVLPYLEADLATHEIVARMAAAGEISRGPVDAQDWVNEKRRQIRDKANKILAATGQALFQGSGHSTSLAEVRARARQRLGPARVPRVDRHDPGFAPSDIPVTLATTRCSRMRARDRGANNDRRRATAPGGRI